MLKQSLRYGAGLIGLYIAVANGSKAGALLKDGASGASNLTRTLQGR